jgi:hypothetical protein
MKIRRRVADGGYVSALSALTDENLIAEASRRLADAPRGLATGERALR